VGVRVVGVGVLVVGVGVLVAVGPPMKGVVRGVFAGGRVALTVAVMAVTILVAVGAGESVGCAPGASGSRSPIASTRSTSG
jgi:hypothetical protein